MYVFAEEFIQMQVHFDTKNTGYNVWVSVCVCVCVRECVNLLILFVSVLKNEE